jgi:hypothetical protein
VSRIGGAVGRWHQLSVNRMVARPDHMLQSNYRELASLAQIGQVAGANLTFSC